ncbi:MAG: hypothetical protein PWP65_608 [Clostridia bacterium]|nr:hypothetical protein [Clostridia bacterium]
MRNAKIILPLALVLAAGGYFLAWSVQAGGPLPGSQQDPLVTKSYVDDYLNRKAGELQEQLYYVNSRIKDLEAKVAEIKSKLASKIKLVIGQKKAYIGSREYALPVAPFQTGAGATMVPFRFIGEALGAKVDWEPSRQEVSYSLGGRTIILKIGSTRARVNGQEITLPEAPRLVGDTTVVPLRLVSEQLGARVDWDEATKTITISP